MYAIIEPEVAPTNSKTAPKLQVKSEIIIGRNETIDVMRKCWYVERSPTETESDSVPSTDSL